jgi:leader peptidase (prepilin peptidase) / N-methyltransferase
VIVPALLCWGSFLNVVAYRLVAGLSIIRGRSRCPRCGHHIAWYDNIPVISWIILAGKCRSCHQSISFLYPCIELTTLASLSALLYLPSCYYGAYFIFFSALIVSIRSDLETMLISRFVTLFLIPLALLFAWMHWLPISFLQSVIGTVMGYGVLWLASKLFLLITDKEGIGQGDLELLAFIGSFVGVAGCWFSLFLGALIGSILGVFYITIYNKSKEIRIPFGPFLALGAMVYVLFQEHVLYFIFRF